MKTMTTMPQAMIAGIEFFLMNGEIQFIEDGVHRLFCELDVALAAKLRSEMDQDPNVQKGLDLLGITDPIDQLKQYIFCRFGEFDKVADVTTEGKKNFEYWNCGNRPCPADGILCKLPNAVNGKLTAHEGILIRELSNDKSYKMIADNLHRSRHTIETEVRTIRRKLGSFTKAGICSFAGRNNLL